MSNNCLYRLSGRFSLLINLGVSLILLVDEFEIADRQICLQSIRRCGCFSSGLKWFFQSPVCPLRMKECPSLVKPDMISIVMLTDAFLEKLYQLWRDRPISRSALASQFCPRRRRFSWFPSWYPVNEKFAHLIPEYPRIIEVKCNYFHVFVKEEQHVGMIRICPGIENSREIRSPNTAEKYCL